MVEGLAFLAEEGFKLGGCEESVSEVLGRVCFVEYVSETLGRAVSVRYFPDRPSAWASIRRTDAPRTRDDFDYTDTGSRKFGEPSFAETPGEGLHKLENFLDALRNELSGRHLELLRGGALANDVFDWEPYK